MHVSMYIAEKEFPLYANYRKVVLQLMASHQNSVTPKLYSKCTLHMKNVSHVLSIINFAKRILYSHSYVIV